MSEKKPLAAEFKELEYDDMAYIGGWFTHKFANTPPATRYIAGRFVEASRPEEAAPH